MPKNFLQSQEILKRCFNDVTGKLKAKGGTYTMQDYLNAVYDESSDSLRVVLQGSVPGQTNTSYWGQIVQSENDLPLDADQGTLTPVLKENILQFYYYSNNQWIKIFSSNVNLTDEQQMFIQWGIENKEELQFYVQNKAKIEQLLKSEFAVKTTIIQLTPNISSGKISRVNVDINGNIKNILDTEDLDGDETTHYRIDIDGYVIGLQTYQNSNSSICDRYYTKQVYQKDLGNYGVTHIYMSIEQYEYFSNLQNGKNILKVNYLQSMFGNNFVIKVDELSVPGQIQQMLIMDENDNPIITQDKSQLTHYRYRINGYVTSVQSYSSEQSLQSDQVMPYIIDYNEGKNNMIGYTDVYFTKEAYEQIYNLSYPKNVLKFYYIYQKN